MRGAAVLRIGMIGTENSHITHFTRFLNVEQRHPGVRAAALAGGRSERNLELAELGGIDLIVDKPAQLVDEVDAAIVSTRDGAKHLEDARPLLEAGKPVLVDKPLAASIEHAQELLRITEQNSALLLSCSALRFVPEIGHLVPTEKSGPLRHLHVIGPADPDSDYSGLFFYGIHHVEAALEILGDPEIDLAALDVRAVRRGDTVVATLRIADTEVTFTFVVPDAGSRVPFHATGIYQAAVVSRDLTLGGDYNAPALTEFLTAVETGSVSRSPGQLLAPVAVLSAISSALERN
ncbi:Gfo/Idh/MocA family protein [Brachybacterium fresconis]|uniref:Dehydrogenase n=1 Tax=Brachybacterium fresconis TaxID=173363 RepID=A0ABS4YR08_9MICO|nr:Gfo/Idh/MocA family oxidoreductase [Brachybacterium fresconis]MBP2411199.1 putative dehydrogenase [Brachybacterium fresconis]